MSNYFDDRSTYRPMPYAQSNTGVVASFMNGVYAWMCVGLLVTAIVGWVTAHSPAMLAIFHNPIAMIVTFLAELGLVVAISGAINRISSATATGLFVLYAALNGLLLSGVFLIYTQTSIASAFLVTSAMFGATSVYGFMTRRDLSSLGSILFMALIGLIIASIVNIFLASSMLYWIVTYLGVLIFVGLTAYDTQKLKQIAYQTEGNQALARRLAIVGSLSLYLDFINLLIFMLQIFGDRRRD